MLARMTWLSVGVLLTAAAAWTRPQPTVTATAPPVRAERPLAAEPAPTSGLASQLALRGLRATPELTDRIQKVAYDASDPDGPTTLTLTLTPRAGERDTQTYDVARDVIWYTAPAQLQVSTRPTLDTSWQPSPDMQGKPAK